MNHILSNFVNDYFSNCVLCLISQPSSDANPPNLVLSRSGASLLHYALITFQPMKHFSRPSVEIPFIQKAGSFERGAIGSLRVPERWFARKLSELPLMTLRLMIKPPHPMTWHFWENGAVVLWPFFSIQSRNERTIWCQSATSISVTHDANSLNAISLEILRSWAKGISTEAGNRGYQERQIRSKNGRQNWTNLLDKNQYSHQSPVTNAAYCKNTVISQRNKMLRKKPASIQEFRIKPPHPLPRREKRCIFAVFSQALLEQSIKTVERLHNCAQLQVFLDERSVGQPHHTWSKPCRRYSGSVRSNSLRNMPYTYSS